MPLPLQDAAGGDAATELATIDMVGLGLVGVFVLLGLWRGLWWQVIRFAGLAAAVAVARAGAPSFGTWIDGRWPELGTRVAHGVSWLVVFLAALAVATLLGRLGQKLIEAMQLGWANRAGGALLGAVTGAGIHLAVALGVTQLAPESFVTAHVSGTWTGAAVELVAARYEGAVGSDASTELRSLLDRSRPVVR